MSARPRRPGRSLVALVAAGTVLAALCSAPTVGASTRPPSSARLPSTALPVPSVLLARAQMAAQIGSGAIVQTDPYLGAIRWVANVDGTITGPSPLAPKDVALGFVRVHRKAFGVTLRDLALLRFRRDYVDVLGTHHLSWEQVLGNQPLFGAGLKASVAGDGSLVTVAGPIDHVVRFEAPPRARLSARDALAASRRAAGISGARILAPARPLERAERVRFPTAGGVPLPSWETVTVASPQRGDPFRDRRPNRRHPVEREPGPSRSDGLRTRLATRAGTVPERRRRPVAGHLSRRGSRRARGEQRPRLHRRERRRQHRPSRRDPRPRRAHPVLGPGRHARYHHQHPELQPHLPVHLGPSGGVRLARQPAAGGRPGVLPPERLPRPPGRGADRVHSSPPATSRSPTTTAREAATATRSTPRRWSAPTCAGMGSRRSSTTARCTRRPTVGPG